MKPGAVAASRSKDPRSLGSLPEQVADANTSTGSVHSVGSASSPGLQLAPVGLGSALLFLGLLAAAPVAGQLRFVDVAREAGLLEPTWCGSKEKPHILESNGAGIALLDIEGDGDLDLYLTNGWRTEGRQILERGRNRLYRNRGNGTFEDITDSSGTGDDGWATGVAVGDHDGNGTPDLFVSNFGHDVLFSNNGDGTFRRVAGAPSIDGWSTGAVFFDADADGDEDLFVAAYIDCSLDDVLGAVPQLDWEGMKVMKGPFGLAGAANQYFENLGGDRFEAAEVGLEDKGRYYSFGVIVLDLDSDLDLDLYVANDSNPNYLYSNDGKGVFEEVGLWSGAALDEGGAAQAGMGVTAGDLENDGLVDLFVTNFYRDVSTFYDNQGDLLFEDISRRLGLRESTFMPLSWGTVLADLDLDGQLDLFVANGHIYPQADRAKKVKTSFEQRNLVLRGATLLAEGSSEGLERFVDVTDSAGPGLEVVLSSRGLAAGDLDNDGDLDIVVTNIDAPPTLLRNDSERRGSWLIVDAPDAVRVEVEVGTRHYVRHRVIGGSYLSANDPRFHFGLGQVEGSLALTVFWPDGTETQRDKLAPDQIVQIEP